MIIMNADLFNLCADLRETIDSLYLFVKDNDRITDKMFARASESIDRVLQGCDVDLVTLESDFVNFEFTAWDVLMDNHLILARDKRGKDACRALHTLQRQNQRLTRLIAALK